MWLWIHEESIEDENWHNLVFSRRQVGVEAQHEAISLVEHRPLSLFQGNGNSYRIDDGDDKDDRSSFYFVLDNDNLWYL